MAPQLAGYDLSTAWSPARPEADDAPLETQEPPRPLELHRLRPGDVVLCRRRAPDAATKSIVKAQRRAFDPLHAGWTRAAIHLRDGMAIETTPELDVVVGDLFDELESARRKWDVRARRLVGVDQWARQGVAICALQRLCRRYAFDRSAAAAATGFVARRRFPPALAQQVVCCQVYFDAVLEASHVALRECPPTGPVLPAHLSASPDLRDVVLDPQPTFE